MNVPIWNSVFLRHFKFNNPFRINTKYLSTSLKVCAKKQYKMKNNFTFRDELKQNILKTVNHEPDMLPEQIEGEEEFATHGFISGDLLGNEKKRNRQEITLSREKKKKTSLTYRGEILFGIHPVYLALLQKKRTLYHIYVNENDSSSEGNASRKAEIIKHARLMNIPLSFIDNRGLKILAPGAVHQGICLDAGCLPVSTWNEDQCMFDKSEDRPLWLVLDEILDPMNVGAVIRSAHYFGVDKIFTIIGNSCKLSPTVSKASSGSLEVMNIYQIGNLEDFVKKRKSTGWYIVSTLAYSENKPGISTSISADQFNTSKPTILILGNEGKGISQDILRLCDSLISIEPGRVLPKGIDSLNVSVAAGVLLYALNNFKTNKR